MGHRWAPGSSGNPGGRTTAQREREKRLAAAILGLAGDDCELYAKRLHDIAMGGEAKDSIKAIEVLLTRAIGKPTEHVIVDEQAELSDEEYAAELAAIAREHIAGLSGDEKLRLLSGATTETVQ